MFDWPYIRKYRKKVREQNADRVWEYAEKPVLVNIEDPNRKANVIIAEIEQKLNEIKLLVDELKEKQRD